MASVTPADPLGQSKQPAGPPVTQQLTDHHLSRTDPSLRAAGLQLESRRKSRLSRLVPAEMRQALLEMLDTEPHLRPSASCLLQVSCEPT